MDLAVDEHVAGHDFRLQKEAFLLLHPDEYLLDNLQSRNSELTPSELTAYRDYLQLRRRENPYYMPPAFDRSGHPSSELLMSTTGTGYAQGKLICRLTGAHLVTDLAPRWKQIELDRTSAQLDTEKWAPFAKAISALKLKYLDGIPLDLALEIRKREQLEQMRLFLRRLWNQTAREDEFDPANAALLSAELEHEIREAEREWSALNSEITNRLVQLGFGGVVATAAISEGSPRFVAAAVTVGQLAYNVFSGERDRRQFRFTHPAAFFLGRD
jgi:hypothetical protein